jgi:Mg2+/Co2+ transporter CorB
MKCGLWKERLSPIITILKLKKLLQLGREAKLLYKKHMDKALKIIENAHKFTEQFQNKKREKLISLLVLQKYFNYLKP